MIAPRRLAATLCWLLLASAIVARALVPAGWMPVATKRGIEVVLCTGQGPVTMVLGLDGTPHQRQPDSPRDPCPYGVAGAQPFDLAAAPQLPLPPAVLAAIRTPALVAARLAAWRALRPPARGPPAFA